MISYDSGLTAKSTCVSWVVCTVSSFLIVLSSNCVPVLVLVVLVVISVVLAVVFWHL